MMETMKHQKTQQLEPIERVKLARHDRRPYASDLIERIFTNFLEIHGDRKYGDDPAIIAGLADFQGRPVAIIAHQKGRDIKERQSRNFGMPKPDGYRKALRVMQTAEKFDRPIFTLIDTPGAYPGLDAEERGQAEAIAFNLREMARITVPIIVTVTGEGGSGGALAIGVGDVVSLLENAVYSVITPEGCAAILWKDSKMSPQAAASLKMTSNDLLKLGIIDYVVPEPEGGAQNDWDLTSDELSRHLNEVLSKIEKMSIQERLEKRYQKFRLMGEIRE